MPHSSRRQLADRVRKKDFFAAPGVFDLISAKTADTLEFPALYMTGYGAVASHLGLPDAGLATYSEMLDRARQICEVVETPLIADADTGYGGLLNVERTVRGYERAGVAVMQLEDQEFPKRCGHTPGRRVIPIEDAAAKIRVAVETRDSSDFLIMARTDARSAHGLDEALRRGEAFAKAGADILFIESPETVEEMEMIGRTFDQPLVANLVEGGRTPILNAEQLTEIGYSLSIHPATGFLAMGRVLGDVYGHLRDHRSSVGLDVPLDDFMHFSKLMGFEDVWAFSKKWAEQG